MIVKRYSGSELYHHGVKGQKWGVRRYQNEDGTLTEEGRRRFGTAKNFEKYHNKQKKSLLKEIDTGDAHDKAARIHESRLNKINEKYFYSGKYKWDEVYDRKTKKYTDIGQKYLKEVESSWKNAYEQTLKEYANKYETIGEQAVSDMDVTSLLFYKKNSMARYMNGK